MDIQLRWYYYFPAENVLQNDAGKIRCVCGILSINALFTGRCNDPYPQEHVDPAQAIGDVRA